MLASPSSSRAPAFSNTQDMDDDSGDEDAVGPDGIVMDLSVRTDLSIIPTYDGFKYHARLLNPRIKDYLLERLTQEQVKRYKRLIEYKSKHAKSVTSHSCTSKKYCFALGGESKPLPPRAGNKDPDVAMVGFQIMAPGMTEEDLEITSDGQVIAAQFPTGVPLPPVQRLPAEFECPLCFKVKKFYKPSDWTKHVHEDVQPFTCTFPNCTDPKSFKRKADWVRHENERHRQLECWVCNIGDCTHTCFRKDNFVQHLVREHKVPEPKVRTGRVGGSRSPITPIEPSTVSWTGMPFLSGEDPNEDVWALVEKCHQDASKSPKDEACRFCGNVCSTWKKLTVHLAKHMEQISMPVLGLVEQKRVGAPAMTGFAPTMSPRVMQNMPLGSTIPINELPTGILCAEPSEMDGDGQSMDFSSVTSQIMQTYPPPNMSTILDQVQASPGVSYVGQTYPPVLIPGRSRSPSFHDAQSLQVPGRQPTTYLQNQQQGFFPPQQGYGQAGLLGVQGQYLSPSMSPSSYGYLQQDDTMQNMPGQQMGRQQ